MNRTRRYASPINPVVLGLGLLGWLIVAAIVVLVVALV